MFALATRYIDVAVASVLFETWPIVTVILLGRLLGGAGGGRRVTVVTLGLMCLGLVGFGFVVAGQAGGFRSLFSFDSSMLSTLAGVLLAGLAVALGVLCAFGYRWGAELRAGLGPEVLAWRDSRGIDLFCVVLGTLLANVAAVPFNLAVGWGSGESACPLGAFALSVGGGVSAYGAAGVGLAKG